MAKDETLEPVQFGAADMKTLEEIATQVSACKSASEKSGKSAIVITVFLRMVGFVRSRSSRPDEADESCERVNQTAHPRLLSAIVNGPHHQTY
jgi:hypothetical protein